MKILYINTFYPPHIGGGAEISLKTLVEEVQAQGHEVAVLVTAPEPGLRMEGVDGVRVWRAGLRNVYFPHGGTHHPAWKRMAWHVLDRYNPLMKRYIRQVVDLEKPDLVSCHNLAGWSIAAWDVLREKGIPIIQVLHDQYLLCVKTTMFDGRKCCKRQCFFCRTMRRRHREHSKRVDAVVGVSRFIRDKLLAYGYFEDCLINEAIHNARRFEHCATLIAPRERHSDFIFGFIGNLTPSKGIELLLETFSSIDEPNWTLRVAGNGKRDYEAYLKRTFSDIRIEFIGRVLPQDFFPTVDVTIVPSLWEEPLGMVVAESMMFGVPVIGSARGGIPEMIIPEVNGLLFDPDEEGALAYAMKTFTSLAKKSWAASSSRIALSAVGYADARKWSQNWLSIYSRVLKQI